MLLSNLKSLSFSPVHLSRLMVIFSDNEQGLGTGWKVGELKEDFARPCPEPVVDILKTGPNDVIVELIKKVARLYFVKTVLVTSC